MLSASSDVTPDTFQPDIATRRRTALSHLAPASLTCHVSNPSYRDQNIALLKYIAQASDSFHFCYIVNHGCYA